MEALNVPPTEEAHTDSPLVTPVDSLRDEPPQTEPQQQLLGVQPQQDFPPSLFVRAVPEKVRYIPYVQHVLYACQHIIVCVQHVVYVCQHIIMCVQHVVYVCQHIIVYVQYVLYVRHVVYVQHVVYACQHIIYV